MAYTYEQLQRLGANPVVATPTTPPAPTGGYTFDQLKKMGAKPVDFAPEPESPKEGGGIGGFLKSLVSAPATMVARPFQAGAQLLGASSEEVDRVTKKLTGGLVAPVPQNFGDVKKDIGRGIETVAFGAAGPVSGGLAVGFGSSIAQGNDVFSGQTLFNTVLGGAGGKVLGLVGKPLLDAGGRVIGKITPKYLSNIASKGKGAIQEFAKTHKILPEATSKALTAGAESVENLANKPFRSASNALGLDAESRAARQQSSMQRKNDVNIGRVESELKSIESGYSKTRKAKGFSKDEFASSRSRVVKTGVLDDAVTTDGVITTKAKGGASERYRSMTIEGQEGVVREGLVKEGAMVHLDDVEKELQRAVRDSGLEGDDLATALRKVKGEIEGYRLKANGKGEVPLTLAHDAKISTTRNIDFNTPAEVKTYRKSIAKGLKNTVEKYSRTNVREINAELKKFYDDIDYLEMLDGLRVKGGRLGKYVARISGNLVGGAVGGAVGGFPGMALGTVAGGEASNAITGRMMSGKLGGVLGVAPERSAILQAAQREARAPRLQLTAPKEGAPRSQVFSSKPIILGARSASTVERQSQEKAISSRGFATKAPDKSPPVKYKPKSASANDTNRSPKVNTTKRVIPEYVKTMGGEKIKAELPKEISHADIKDSYQFGSSLKVKNPHDVDIAVFLDEGSPLFKKYGEVFNRKVGKVEYHVLPDNENGRDMFSAMLDTKDKYGTGKGLAQQLGSKSASAKSNIGKPKVTQSSLENIRPFFTKKDWGEKTTAEKIKMARSMNISYLLE